MLKGNKLYDTITAQNVSSFYDAEEAITVSGMEDFLGIERTIGVVDVCDLPKLCDDFFNEGGAYVVIIPPDNTVLVLVHRGLCLTLFDSHHHDQDGALMFFSKNPKDFSRYFEVFAISDHCTKGLLGANIFKIMVKK